MSSPTRNAFLYSLIVAFGGFVFGLDIVLISGTIKAITSEFGLTALEVGSIVSGPGWGALVGLICTSYFSDKFGRKNTTLVIAALYTLSAIGSAYAPSATFLFWARFLGGLAFASLSLASMYIGEIAPPKSRGKLVGLNQLNIVIGIFIAQILNYYIINGTEQGAAWTLSLGLNAENAWRWMLGAEIIPALLWFSALFIVPESPRWLALNGKEEKAKAALAKITEPEKLDQEINEIVHSLNDTDHHTLSLAQQFKLLFSSKMRIALIIGVVITIIQPMTGMNAVLAYMPTIFAQLGGSESSAFGQTVMVGGIGLFFTVLALVFIDKLGRRPILLGGLTWAIISLAVVALGFFNATYMLTAESLVTLKESMDVNLLQSLLNTEFSSDVDFKQAIENKIGREQLVAYESSIMTAATTINGLMVLLGIISFQCAYNFSLGPVVWILLSEVFTTKVRAVAIPLCGFVASVFGGIIVPLFFPWQLENMGAVSTFSVYLVCCFIGLIFAYKVIPETKNKTIEQIELELAGK
ncbi:MFS transporter [Paraglaciecola aquimarina]|uniref:MFS transporter n=1 Tax=Paraglaciecola algarum TaxID=3050085 RepID=A0ABS9DAN9_9ALTE|nr:MFS transporter [Paraglaciecola sp. G1-23]MCF2950022.1 MFS transporter [Paraglaciecola sp. G1-23]